eukprot:TRINITY_DN2134_c0_g1_i1.p1 TRINITY_DN2134_c0_g1~~TRINITY_DN2134_c0_g1_i1.p1  ORF type:complete len:709 (+),score=195.03 TRINITY_DN2134_c0_g1_i1:224-2350(+)
MERGSNSFSMGSQPSYSEMAAMIAQNLQNQLNENPSPSFSMNQSAPPPLPPKIKREGLTPSQMFDGISRYICFHLGFCLFMEVANGLMIFSKISFLAGILFGLLITGAIMALGLVYVWFKYARKEEMREKGRMDEVELDRNIQEPGGPVPIHENMNPNMGYIPPGVPESCEWFNILFQKILREHFNDESWKKQYEVKLQRLFNPISKPEFIGDIQVESIDFGSNRIQLSNIRLLSVPSYNLNTRPCEERDLGCEFDVKYFGNSPLVISISTMVYINWPIWHLAHFPISFDLCLDYLEGSMRLNISGGMNPLCKFGFVKEPITRFRAASSIGSLRTAFTGKDPTNSRFRIPKVSSFLIKKCQGFLAKEMVVPEGVCCHLPVKGIRPLKFKLLRKYKEQQELIRQEMLRTGQVPPVDRSSKPNSRNPSPSSSKVGSFTSKPKREFLQRQVTSTSSAADLHTRKFSHSPFPQRSFQPSLSYSDIAPPQPGTPPLPPKVKTPSNTPMSSSPQLQVQEQAKKTSPAILRKSGSTGSLPLIEFESDEEGSNREEHEEGHEIPVSEIKLETEEEQNNHREELDPFRSGIEIGRQEEVKQPSMSFVDPFTDVSVPVGAPSFNRSTKPQYVPHAYHGSPYQPQSVHDLHEFQNLHQPPAVPPRPSSYQPTSMASSAYQPARSNSYAPGSAPSFNRSSKPMFEIPEPKSSFTFSFSKK